MIFSNTTEYAIPRPRRTRRPLQWKDHAPRPARRRTNLPRDFLAKIFQKLVRAKLLTSAKGRGGGFALARPAHAITLMDIVEAIEGPKPLDGCVVGLERCNDDMPCPQHDLYKPIRQRLKDYMNTTTLADLASSLKSKQTWHRQRSTVLKS
jgi:Rrf2 family protein